MGINAFEWKVFWRIIDEREFPLWYETTSKWPGWWDYYFACYMVDQWLPALRRGRTRGGEWAP